MGLGLKKGFINAAANIPLKFYGLRINTAKSKLEL